MDKNEPTCPDCGVYLTWDDCGDWETGWEGIYLKNLAHCPYCNADYRYTEIYTYSHFEDLTRIR